MPRPRPRRTRSGSRGAKDYIADEQWQRAIDELKAAVADTKEPNRDEALFWLAHSEHQVQDLAAAVDTIARLEHDFPSSRWVRPARSLRVEIAQQLRRNDVLWYAAVRLRHPPPPPLCRRCRRHRSAGARRRRRARAHAPSRPGNAARARTPAGTDSASSDAPAADGARASRSGAHGFPRRSSPTPTCGSRRSEPAPDQSGQRHSAAQGDCPREQGLERRAPCGLRARAVGSPRSANDGRRSGAIGVRAGAHRRSARARTIRRRRRRAGADGGYSTATPRVRTRSGVVARRARPHRRHGRTAPDRQTESDPQVRNVAILTLGRPGRRRFQPLRRLCTRSTSPPLPRRRCSSRWPTAATKTS